MRVLEQYDIINRNEDIEYKYVYRLIQNQYEGYEGYGIEIVRNDYKNLIKVHEEKDSVKLMSMQKTTVKHILMKLIKNVVSPIHLVDVVGEFTDNHAYEFDLGLLKEA